MGHSWVGLLTSYLWVILVVTNFWNFSHSSHVHSWVRKSQATRKLVSNSSKWATLHKL